MAIGRAAEQLIAWGFPKLKACEALRAAALNELKRGADPKVGELRKLSRDRIKQFLEEWQRRRGPHRYRRAIFTLKSVSAMRPRWRLVDGKLKPLTLGDLAAMLLQRPLPFDPGDAYIVGAIDSAGARIFGPNVLELTPRFAALAEAERDANWTLYKEGVVVENGVIK